ncbi:uncharacterized protein Tco025E_09624, partial [Trypanosoma conorhini]
RRGTSGGEEPGLGRRWRDGARCEPEGNSTTACFSDSSTAAFYLFVNGEALKVADADAAALAKKDSEEIAHFYFGADDGMRGAGGSVTVTNVFRMSRPERSIGSDTPNHGAGSGANKLDSSVRAHGSRVLLLLLGLWGLAAFLLSQIKRCPGF